MAERLGGVCRQARLDAGRHALDIATAAGVSEATISRFEAGDGWRWKTDEIVAAYATETGLTALALWRRAVD